MNHTAQLEKSDSGAILALRFGTRTKDRTFTGAQGAILLCRTPTRANENILYEYTGLDIL